MPKQRVGSPVEAALFAAVTNLMALLYFITLIWQLIRQGRQLLPPR